MRKLPIVVRSKGDSTSRLAKAYRKDTILIRIPNAPIPIRKSATVGIIPTSRADFGISLYAEYTKVSTAIW